MPLAVGCSERALRHLERIVEFLTSEDAVGARAVAPTIIEAISILTGCPLIGRPARRDRRERVISHGRTGYVALYRYRPRAGRVEVLAIRSQREAG